VCIEGEIKSLNLLELGIGHVDERAMANLKYNMSMDLKSVQMRVHLLHPLPRGDFSMTKALETPKI